MIITMMGLPGSGKTTVAKELVKNLPAVLLNKDEIRAAIFPPPEIEYSTSQDDFIVSIMMQIANFYIKDNTERHIILDGRPFSRKYQVDMLVDFSKTHHWDLKVIYCYCVEDISRARIQHDFASKGHLAKNRDLNLYYKIKQQEDPLVIPHLALNTNRLLSDCVNECFKYLNVD